LHRSRMLGGVTVPAAGTAAAPAATTATR
jgi:hypothetical protein